jgi:hypothetical protein
MGLKVKQPVLDEEDKPRISPLLVNKPNRMAHP